MNVSLFIARKLYFNQSPDKRILRLAIQIATFGVTLGLVVMILSVCILSGFRNEIREQIVGFGSHIQILNSNSASSPESFPVVTDKSFISKIQQQEGVEHVQRFSQKLGLIKTENDFKGILLKGIGEEYNTLFLKKHIVKGKLPAFSTKANRNDIIISQLMANQMKLNVGDKLYAYFFENTIRMRRFNIVGIYQTNMNQFDENVIIANLYSVNQLNNWKEDQSSGLEVYTSDFSNINPTYTHVLNITRDAIDRDGNMYSTFQIQELYYQIFDWLKLLDLNVWVILVLMIFVASFTVISGLLILILERTNTIGILKAVGGSNSLIRRIFVNYSTFIMIRGIVWGNIIGLGLALLQDKFRIITLDASKYYVDHVPILFDPTFLILLNIGTIMVCVLAMIGPSYLVSKIRPVKAIRFD